MPRIVNETEYAEKRNEILNAAERLIYTKGYEQMAVQDILDALSISKGAFYHYFASKPALLEALIERMEQQVEQIIRPILDDPDLTALEKIARYFDTVTRWKTAQKDYLMAILRIWYTDENAIVRQKLTAAGIKWVTPMFTQIIHQGIAEGVFHTPFADQVSDVVVALLVSLGETLTARFLALGPGCGEPELEDCMRSLENTSAVYTDAIERVLGAPTGSLHLVDTALLKVWVTP